jgi:hypothetical protein
MTIVKRCFIIAMFILPLGVLAQLKRTDVPLKVRIQFMEDYVSARNATWQLNPDNNYEVTFFHQSQNKSATYSSDGIMLVTKTKLTSLYQLPENIARSTKSKFKKYFIEDISKIESRQQITYEVIGRNERNAYNLIFEPSGKMRKKRV